MVSKIDKWYKWLDAIKNDVQALTLSRHVYEGMATILRENGSLPKSAFWEFLEVWHAQSAVMAIRRQVKLDDKSVSWIRFLTDVSKNAEIISRDWFRSLYQGSVVSHTADNAFDEFAGPGGSHLRREFVDDDISRLKAVCRKAEAYAGRTVAHRDLRGVEDLPTYTDIDEAVDFFEALLKRYELVLRACNLLSALPEIHHDWKAVFRVPWDAGGQSA